MDNYVPLIGEIKSLLVGDLIQKHIWNGEKWLRFADIYPLMYYAQTGKPLVLDEGQTLD